MGQGSYFRFSLPWGDGLMKSMGEFHDKQRRMQALLEQHQLDALLLGRVSSFAWATCGAASYVNTAIEHSRSQLLITKHKRYLITDNIEVTRLIREEKLNEQRWEILAPDWHSSENPAYRLTKGLKLGSDIPFDGSIDLSSSITKLRTDLTVSEIKRFKKLAQLCAQAMEATVRSVRPGQTEYFIAAKLAQESGKRGIQAIVNLVGTDDRIYAFRHPLPTPKKLERYAMLVLCGRKWGLVCSLTRFVHFGPLPDTLKKKAVAVARVDATFIANTQPGRQMGEIFKHGMAAYVKTGYPEEWQFHHQGGLAGYEPREIVATSDSKESVSTGRVFAWNPSITGTKSEDTILVTEKGCKVLTEIKDWPTIPVEIDGQTFFRPAILERK
jgi:Xaa-Pro aminopeptidase